MSRKISNSEVEIIVSTYWPTKIIKRVFIKNLKSEHFRKEIDFDREQAEYVLRQLQAIFEPGTVEPTIEKVKLEGQS